MIVDIYEVTIDGKKYTIMSEKLRWDYPDQRIPTIANRSYIAKTEESDQPDRTVRKVPSPLIDELAGLARAVKAPPFVLSLLERIQEKRRRQA